MGQLTTAIVLNGEVVLVQVVEIEGAKKGEWRRQKTRSANEDCEVCTHVLSYVSMIDA